MKRYEVALNYGATTVDEVAVNVFPPTHLASCRKWWEPSERSALVQACDEIDPGRLGRVPVAAIGKILAAVGSEVPAYFTAFCSDSTQQSIEKS